MPVRACSICAHRSTVLIRPSVAYPQQPNITLTPDELLQHNGSDPSKPLYLAVDGEVFDVSENRRVYGPGGSYHIFAGKDCARAYATGCFRQDCTYDLRGLDEKQLKVRTLLMLSTSSMGDGLDC